ncbi:MAG: hypothetical protein ACD_79C00654G0002 [uncultured bacterium]|nr:MAG: hypothetical protein ACD_79C00654G0002 [uncultured bacterium]
MVQIEKDFIISNLKQFMDPERSASILAEVIEKTNISDKVNFSLNEAKIISQTLIDKGGFAEFVGHSLLIKVNTLKMLNE